MNIFRNKKIAGNAKRKRSKTKKALFTIRDDGNVGIGFDNPTQKLAVNGKVRIGENEVSELSDYIEEYMLSVDGAIIAEKVVVSVSEWADSVFEPDYALMPLDVLSEYIKTYNRLPAIPNVSYTQPLGATLKRDSQTDNLHYS